MKKGVSLIEVLISAALIGIIITYEVEAFGRYAVISKRNLKNQEIERYVEEAFDFIGDQVKSCRHIRIEGDCIILKMTESESENRIELIPSNNLVIDYGNKAVTIANNIQNFNVFVHNEVMYVSLTDINGEKYEKCYGIKYLK